MRSEVLAPGALLVALTLGVYAQVLGFDFVNLDDPFYVYTNPHVLAGPTFENIGWAFTTGHEGGWRPLVWLSFRVDSALAGPEPAIYHATNLLLHLANTLLLFGLLRTLTGALWQSAIAAALFAVHPQHVEAVAWVTSRKDVLSTLFWLLTTLAYVTHVRPQPPHGEVGRALREPQHEGLARDEEDKREAHGGGRQPIRGVLPGRSPAAPARGRATLGVPPQVGRGRRREATRSLFSLGPMKPTRVHRVLLLAALLHLAADVAGVGGAVLCVGPNDHRAIELGHLAAGCDAPAFESEAAESGEDCTGCSDSPLHADAERVSERLDPDLSPPATLGTAFQALPPPSLALAPAPATRLRQTTTIRALRSIVLLI